MIFILVDIVYECTRNISAIQRARYFIEMLKKLNGLPMKFDQFEFDENQGIIVPRKDEIFYFNGFYAEWKCFLYSSILNEDCDSDVVGDCIRRAAKLYIHYITFNNTPSLIKTSALSFSDIY